MGVLRLVPKTKRIQFIPVQTPSSNGPRMVPARDIEIVLGEITVRIPNGSDPDTLKQVLQVLRQP